MSLCCASKHRLQGLRDALARLGRASELLCYPKQHWIHLGTTNIVGSPFSAVRLRSDGARRFKKTENAEAMIWNPLRVAEQSWRRLNASKPMKNVCDGKPFNHGPR